MKEQNTLCAVNAQKGSIDVWVNYDNQEAIFKDAYYNIIVTYNGTKPEEGYAYAIRIEEAQEVVLMLDTLMGRLGRDAENWDTKNITFHWGANEWKFINSRNVTTIEKDEYVKNLDDIKYFYEIEW